MATKRKINLNDMQIGLEQFTDHFDEYALIIQHFFRASTIQKRENESQSELAKRIFDLLYYSKGLGIRQTPVVSTQSESILSSLGFDIVRRSGKSSSVIFKQSGTSGRIKNDLLDRMAASIKADKDFYRIPVDISFGIELEFIKPHTPNGTMTHFHNEMKSLVGNDRYVCVNHYCHNNGDEWILGKDSSVKGKDCIGLELSSPIMHCTTKDFKEINDVINLVKNILHGTVNNTCGTHVHISFDSGQALSHNMIEYFFNMYGKNEECLFDKVVAKRRNDSRWCRSNNLYSMNNRYSKMNVNHAIRDLYNDCSDDSDSIKHMVHLEFRQLQGTLDFNLIKAWIKLQKLFIEYTLYYFDIHEEYESTKDIILGEVLCQKEFSKEEVESLLTSGSELYCISHAA